MSSFPPPLPPSPVEERGRFVSRGLPIAIACRRWLALATSVGGWCGPLPSPLEEKAHGAWRLGPCFEFPPRLCADDLVFGMAWSYISARGGSVRACSDGGTQRGCASAADERRCADMVAKGGIKILCSAF